MSTRFTPTALVAFTAVLWGTVWLPSRWLDEVADGRLWAWLAAFALPLVLLAPGLAQRARALLAHGPLFWLTAAMFAFSLVLYPEALLRGQVARVLLLFHVSVVWSTLFARLFLGEPVTRRRLAAVVLGLGGLVALFGVDAGLPLPRSTADVMALLSGVLWSGALTGLRRLPAIDDRDKVIATCLLLAVAFALISLAPGGRTPAAPEGAEVLPALAIGLLIAAVWVIPVLWATMQAAQHLEPGRMSVILMLELVVGIVSAAWLGGEIPGHREFAGMVLIVAALGAELLPARRPVRIAGSSEDRQRHR